MSKCEIIAVANQKGGVGKTTTTLSLDTKLEKSAKEIAEDNSERQVYRYIRLTSLIPELLAFVDEKKIGFRTAVELSYLSEFSQEAVFDYSEQYAVIPSLSQAVFFKKEEKAGTLTEDTIELDTKDNFERYETKDDEIEILSNENF